MSRTQNGSTGPSCQLLLAHTRSGTHITFSLIHNLLTFHIILIPVLENGRKKSPFDCGSRITCSATATLNILHDKNWQFFPVPWDECERRSFSRSNRLSSKYVFVEGGVKGMSTKGNNIDWECSPIGCWGSNYIGEDCMIGSCMFRTAHRNCSGDKIKKDETG